MRSGSASADTSAAGRLVFRCFGLRRVRHHAQHCDRETFACEKDQADADPDRGFDDLQPEAERDPASLRHPVVREERKGDGRLHEPDVARPEREDRRDVHQHQHDPGGGQSLVDPERAHRRVDREQLTCPPEHLEEDRERCRPGLAHHTEAVAREPDHLPHGTEPLVDACVVVATGSHDRDAEEHDARGDDGDQARDGPVRDVRGDDDVDDQRAHGNEVEHAVREDRAEEPGPGALLLHVPVQHSDTRELADSSREDRVREEPDGERREDEHETRVRRVEGLHDDRPPRERAREHREQVQSDGGGNPFPFDRPEHVADGSPGRPSPPEEQDHADGSDDDDRCVRPAVPDDVHEPEIARS